MNSLFMPAFKPILFIVLSFLLLSCQPEDDRVKRKKAIDQKVIERVANYTRIHKENCRIKILEEAGRIVDSILLVEARLKLDSPDKPAKPMKPEMPGLIEVTDSTEVAPFFKDSSLELHH